MNMHTCFLLFILLISNVNGAENIEPIGGEFLTQIFASDWNLMEVGASIRIVPILGKPFYGFGQHFDKTPSNISFNFSPDDVLLQAGKHRATLAELVYYIKAPAQKNEIFEVIISEFFLTDTPENRTELCGFTHPRAQQYRRPDGSLVPIFLKEMQRRKEHE